MTRTNPFKQRGIVLIFTMIMLLLLTLVTVNMIQSNRQELAMSSNSMQQSTMFALAESTMVQAARALEKSPVHLDSSGLQCTPTQKLSSGQYVQTQILAGEHPDGFPENASIVRVACLRHDSTVIVGGINPADATKEVVCSTYKPGGQVLCYEDDEKTDEGDGVECEFIGVTTGATPIPSNDYVSSDHSCYNTLKENAAEAKCPIEMYTIRVTANDGYGSQRIVESKYGIDCGASN